MKAACFPSLILLLAMSYAALMPATSYANETQQTSQSSKNENFANSDSARSHDDRSHDAEHPVPADDGSRQKEGTSSDKQQPSHHAAAKNHSRSRASLTPASRPIKLPHWQQHSQPGSAVNLHQPSSRKSDGPMKDGLGQNETANSVPHVRSTSVVRPNVASLNPWLNNVRHRGPNPAVIGGSANSDNRSTGAINGTHMNHRP